MQDMRRAVLQKRAKRPRLGPKICLSSSSDDEVVEFEDANNARSGPSQSRRSSDSRSDSDFEEEYGPRGKPLLGSSGANSSSVQAGDGIEPGHCLPWPERFAPSSTDLLVLGKSTVNKIRRWIKAALSCSSSAVHPAGLLILTGPAGAGKSTAVHLIAKDFDCRVDEWKAPYLSAGNQSTTQLLTESLRSFIVGTKYPSLMHLPNESRLLLLDDFPRALSDARQQSLSDLSEVLHTAATSTLVPVVLIISDTSKQRARSLRALGAEFLESPHVTILNVPAVTDIAMTRAIKLVLLRVNSGLDNASFEEIVHSSHGDLRSALNCLQLHSMNKYTESSTRYGRRSSLKRSWDQRSIGPGGASRLLELAPGVGADSSLDTFHAVSKILNNKRHADGLSKYNPEQVLEESRAEALPFLSFLHQNYPLFFTNCDDAANALEFLSDASSMITWRDDATARGLISDCAAAVATRGFLECNQSPIRSGWRPIHGSDDPSVRAEARELLENAQRLFANQEFPIWFSARPLAMDLVPYMDIIGWPQGKSQLRRSKERSRFKYVLPIRPSGRGNLGGREGAVEFAMIEEEEGATRSEFASAMQRSGKNAPGSGEMEYELQRLRNVELMDDIIEDSGD
jgi:cell cycle checkpoint protein